MTADFYQETKAKDFKLVESEGQSGGQSQNPSEGQSGGQSHDPSGGQSPDQSQSQSGAKSAIHCASSPNKPSAVEGEVQNASAAKVEVQNASAAEALGSTEAQAQSHSALDSTASSCEARSHNYVDPPAIAAGETLVHDLLMEEPHKPHVWASQSFQGDLGSFAAYESWGTFWESRGRQLFNAVYFALALVALYVIGWTSDFLLAPVSVCAVFFGLLGFGALIYSIFHRYPAGSSDVFSARTQKNLRRFALIAPLAVMLFAGWNCLSFAVTGLWNTGCLAILWGHNDMDGSEKKYIDLAANISPLNTVSARSVFERASNMGDSNHELYLEYYQQRFNQGWLERASDVGLFERDLTLADRMIFLKPHDVDWKIRRLGMLGRLPGKESEFTATSEQYQQSFAENGFLWNTLANVAYYKRDWPLALEMANKHLQIHDKEFAAYQQRGMILKQLGRIPEAEADLAKANTFTGNK